MREMRRARLTVAASVLAVVAIVAQGAAAAGPTDQAQPARPLVTGRLLVSVSVPERPTGASSAARARRSRRGSISRDLLDLVADRNELSVRVRSTAGGFLAVDPAGEPADRLRRRLATDPLVESVRPEHRALPRLNPADPAFLMHDPHAPFGDFAQWQLGFAGFPRAWELSRGNGAEVAVVDSGASVDHPDLSSRVSGTLDCSAIACGGTGVADASGHGTHVAGLACADSGNAIGIASAGFDCSLYVIRTDLGYGSIINSIYAAADHGSDAINMSFGGGPADPELREAIEYAWSRGSIPVAAGANEPSPSAELNHPAEDVQPEGSGADLGAGMGLVVTSAKYSGARSATAQRTTGVSVAGYGSASDLVSGGSQGILSTWPPASPAPALDTRFENRNPPQPVRTSLLGDDRYAYLVGTSMAAPEISGLVALIRAARPQLPAARVVRLVKLTAGACGEYTRGLGWGTIDAGLAVGAALDRDLDPPASRVTAVTPVGGPGARPRVLLRLKRSDDTCSPELPRAGLRSAGVFASVGGGPYRRIRKTRAKAVVIGVKRGRRYRFFSTAVDRAGNREPRPDSPDAKLQT